MTGVRANDQKSTIAYEGIRKWKRGASTAVADFRTTSGKITKGNFRVHPIPQRISARQRSLVEEPSNEGCFEHIWEFDAPQIADRWLVVDAKRIDGGHANNQFQFSSLPNPMGRIRQRSPFPIRILRIWRSYRPNFATNSMSKRPAPAQLASSDACDKLYVDAMAISYCDTIGPFAQGDLVVTFVNLIKDASVPIVLYRPASAATDLGLYGSSHVGILGGIISPTNVSGILQLDLLKTDYFHDPHIPLTSITTLTLQHKALR